MIRNGLIYLSLFIACVAILSGCSSTPNITPPALPVAKAQAVHLTVAAQPASDAVTLSVMNNPGTVDIYDSTDLENWSYVDTVPETNSLLLVDDRQTFDFYRGQVSGIAMNILWSASPSTNVTGYFIYTGPSPNQFT